MLGDFFHGIRRQVGTGRRIIVGLDLIVLAPGGLFHGDRLLQSCDGHSQGGGRRRGGPQDVSIARRRSGRGFRRQGPTGDAGDARTQLRQDNSTRDALHDENDDDG